ncbi:MAG: serine/threonine protein kinase psk1 [Cirrosporium novae-zelandiae]|nr:MAG: serine/threonine protein kinase psk1 [Cirrosporium novae-zelandiae]
MFGTDFFAPISTHSDGQDLVEQTSKPLRSTEEHKRTDGSGTHAHVQRLNTEKVLAWNDADSINDAAVAAAVKISPSIVRTGTPPIDIAGAQTPKRNLGNNCWVSKRLPVDMMGNLPKANELSARAQRKRKKAQKKAAVPPAAPALNVVRGFTPASSVNGDSEYSTAASSRIQSPRISALTGYGGSPSLRPSSSSGGISALRLQLETLNLDTHAKPSALRSQANTIGSQTPSNFSVTSEAVSETPSNETTCYEVPLKNDFVSPDIIGKPLHGAVEGGATPSFLNRKMTASDFSPLKCLGKGTYGTVLLVKQATTGRLFAQKQFRKASLTVHKKLVEQTKTERSILESVNRHPFVVKLYYAFQDCEKLYLILEYAQGGELFTHLALEKMFLEDDAAFYMAEMVLALEHLHHTVGVIYRDLKPENCLLDSEGHLLLADFGLSKVAVDDERCNSSLGTIEYMAPEVIQGIFYGKACDWWSLGALGFDLLTGNPPFTANNYTRTQEKILKQKLSLPYFLSPDAKDLLTRLLRKDPSKRLGGNMPKDMTTIKKHRFFRKINWAKLAKRQLDPPIRPLITDPELAENFATEFTDLSLSPVVERGSYSEEGNPFGGFSFVASQSFLETEFMSDY